MNWEVYSLGLLEDRNVFSNSTLGAELGTASLGFNLSNTWLCPQPSSEGLLRLKPRLAVPSSAPKVLFEKTFRSLKSREYTSQFISPPIILTLSMQEEELLKKHMDVFTRVGFEIEPFGGNEYAVRAVPDNLFSLAKKELLMEMLDALSEDSGAAGPEAVYDRIASMSCKAAVKGNDRLSEQEADRLIDELLGLENPYACPHGRPTIISISKYEMEKKFKRIV